MPKDAVFTMKLDAELRDEFMVATAGEDRPASQVMRELMRTYIEQQRQAREYDDYLRQKVETARASMRAGQGRTNDEVEASFSALRDKVAPGRT
jgi:hypothetical protein